MINLEGECVIEQDLHTVAGNVGEKIGDMAAVTDNPSYGGFEAMEMGDQGLVMGKDLSWVETEQENVLDMNDASSIFYSDVPSLPDFPCMSSSSSSSSAPPVAKAVAASSSASSAASSSSPGALWVVSKLVAEEETERRKRQVVEVEHASLSSTASMEIAPPLDATVNVECIDIMENLGYMDLIDSNELWDPSSIFQGQEFLTGDIQGAAAAAEQEQTFQCREESDGLSLLQENKELSLIFFEWLKQNKDYISAEDVRKIKLKRSTIENASKLLGSSKEGKKHLLKLILEWVEQYHLQKKGRPQSPYQFQVTIQNPEFNPIINPIPISPNHCNACFSTSPWTHPAPPSHPESCTLVAMPPCFPLPVIGYSTGGNPYSNPVPISPVYHQMINGTMPYSMMNNAQSWTPPPFPVPSHQQTFFGNNPYQILDTKPDTLLKVGSSATKEARKKRMARQKRLYLHHHRHNSSQNQMENDSHEFDDAGEDGHVASPPGGGNWMYCPAAVAATTPLTETIMTIPPMDALQPHTEDQTHMQNQYYQRQSPPDRLQQGGCNAEKNLKFLLQKVLKQSDVGNLGRIVLPKKEAEKHLPDLESRDGITIAMEDIGSCRVWNMRYRFWPNNKSRMYLLENTGDFVRTNGLQEGDFIVIYLDTKCGKYMIRGVKVREPGTKLDGKKPAKRNVRNLSRAHNSSSLVPIKQALR